MQKENCGTAVHGGGGLELGEAGERASIPPFKALYIHEHKTPLKSWPFAAPCWLLQEEDRPCDRRDQLFPQKSPGSPNFVITPPVERATVHLRVLGCPATRLFCGSVTPARVPHPPEGHQIDTQRRHSTGWAPSLTNQTAAVSQPTG